MSNTITEYLKQYNFLSLADIATLAGMFRVKRLKAGEHIVSVGDIRPLGIIVIKGLLRSYAIRKDGSEVTVLITSEGMKVGAYKAMLKGEPSTEYIHAIEDSLVLTLDFEKGNPILDVLPAMVKIERNALKENLYEAAERIHFYTVMTPEERFLYIRENRPDLIQRVPQKYLASFMGITPVSLSRLKARITSKV